MFAWRVNGAPWNQKPPYQGAKFSNPLRSSRGGQKDALARLEGSQLLPMTPTRGQDLHRAEVAHPPERLGIADEFVVHLVELCFGHAFGKLELNAPELRFQRLPLVRGGLRARGAPSRGRALFLSICRRGP